MLKYFTLIAATALIFLQPLPAQDYADCTHTTKKTSDNYFGVGQLQLATPLFDDNTAVSLLGEIGPKSYRGSGTVGAFYECHRVKVGGEYLGQKMSYNFCTGNEKHWVQQYAVGGRYEYVMGCDFLKGLYIDGSSSCANSKELPDFEFTTSSIANGIETITDTVVRKHLLGARYVNIEIGGEFTPWECASFLVGVGYDDLRYGKNHDCRKKSLQGVTVDLEFIQHFYDNVTLDLTAQFRRPYTYAEALIDWHYDTGCGIFSLGIFGGYIWGRDRLPNSTNAGIEIGYSFGPGCCTNSSCCYTSNYCCDMGCCPPSRDCQELIAWVNKPAVYMPAVLVVADQLVASTVTQISVCTAPTLTSDILDQAYDVPVPVYYLFSTPTAQNFSGNEPITYTLNIISQDPDMGSTIDPTTGVIDSTIAMNVVDTFVGKYSVTATNACGTITSNVFTISITNSS